MKLEELENSSNSFRNECLVSRRTHDQIASSCRSDFECFWGTRPGEMTLIRASSSSSYLSDNF